jgi:hypothetical protein
MSKPDPYEAWANMISDYHSKGTQQVTNTTKPSVNQTVVSSAIRGLQSRTDRRGKELAKFERSRTAVKTAVKNLRLVGYPVGGDLLDFKDALTTNIVALAKDQTLDRQLLKQQYVLQRIARPGKEPKADVKIGDIIVVTDPDRSDYWAYKTGTKARLISTAGNGEWLADFNDQGNPLGSFDPEDGKWFILRKEFKLA